MAVSSQRDVHRYFYRTILADGRAFLIRRTSLRCFDAAGRITTARPPAPCDCDHVTREHT